MIKAIFFDLWGTLVESGVRPSVIQQTKRIMFVRNMHFSEYVEKLEKSLMTKVYEDKAKAFEDLCKELGVRPNKFMIEKLIGLWNSNIILATLYDDTLNELEKLKKKYKIILISNMPSFSEQVLDKFDLHKYFDLELLSFREGMLKNDKEFFEKGLKHFNLKKEEAIMVGDSIETDIQGAMNAGIKAILVDRRNKREYSPKITSLAELENFLN